MQVKGTYFQNDKENPLVYGDINLINPPRRRLRGEEEKEGILAETSFSWKSGFTWYNKIRKG